MNQTDIIIVKALLEIGAVKLFTQNTPPKKPFDWASGWKSPIYCNNRDTLSFPHVRNVIKEAFVNFVRSKYPDAEGIAGVATGAIAHGALVADVLGLPFVYVRSAPKGHGLENLVEGRVSPGQKLVIIEDLVSTGGSSIKVVNALREKGAEVLGMGAIFTYGFQTAIDNFQNANCELTALTNFDVLLPAAIEKGLITDDLMDTIKLWREHPEIWNGE